MFSSCRRTVLIGLLALLAFGCEKKSSTTRGSGVQKSETRELGAFRRLVVEGPFEVTVAIGKVEPAELSGDDNFPPLVETKLEGERLVLRQAKPLNPTMPFRVQLSTPSLEAVAAGVTAKVRITGLKAERFEVTGAGATRVTASGSAETLSVTGKMAARFELAELAVRSATVKLEKAAQAELGYVEKLDVTLSGAARVSYPGDPELKKDVKDKARLIQRPK